MREALRARAAAELHPLIRQRWSPAAFGPRPVEPERLRLLFEAARWAPSAFNEQPWRFLVATRNEPDEIERLYGYLTDGNEWARGAPVLVASAFATRYSRNRRVNRLAMRDLGAAEENLFLQACALGLVMRQIAGFDHERLRRELLPEGFEPGTITALGYPASAPAPAASRSGRRPRKRERNPLSEFVYTLRWGEPQT